MVIPDVVDNTLFYLMNAIDNGIIPLRYKTDKGKTVDLSSVGEGEMAGWYVGDDSWREKFSKERYVDMDGVEHNVE
jgi:hypothetical protein